MQGGSRGPTFSQVTAIDYAGTIDIPSDVQTGDYIILVHFWASNSTPTTPASPGTWTQLATIGLAGVPRLTAYGHVVAPGDAGTAVTVSTGNSRICAMLVYRGVNTGTPMDNTVVAATDATASTTKTATGITTLTHNATVVSLMGQTSSTITAITPGTTRLNAPDVALRIAAQELGVSVAGASGNFTVTQGTQQRLFFITLALRAA